MTDTNQNTTEQGKQAASEVAQHAQGKAGEVAGTAKSEARSVASDAKNQAAQVLDTARSELRTQAADQAKTLSTTLNDIGRQLGDMADSSDEPDAQVAQLARSAADMLSQRAERMNEGGIEGVVDDMKRFARNRPGSFLLGSIAAGFAIGRLAKHADLDQVKEQAKSEFGTDSLKPNSDSSGSDSGNAELNSPTGSIGQTDTSVPAGSPRPLAGGVTS